MTDTVNVIRTLLLPADKVWQAISQIGGLDRWFPIISACHVVGSGVGATRLLILAAGGHMRDVVEVIDHQHQFFQYQRTESPLPVSSYRGRVTIAALSPNSSELTWSIEMLVNDISAEQRAELHSFIESALSDGIKGLEQELSGVGNA